MLDFEGDAIPVLVGREQGRELLLGVGPHGAEFVHLEDPAEAGDPGLPKEHRTAIEPDEHGDEQQHRTEDEQGRRAADHVHSALYEVGAAHQPSPREAAHPEMISEPPQTEAALKGGKMP